MQKLRIWSVICGGKYNREFTPSAFGAHQNPIEVHRILGAPKGVLPEGQVGVVKVFLPTCV